MVVFSQSSGCPGKRILSGTLAFRVMRICGRRFSGNGKVGAVSSRKKRKIKVLTFRRLTCTQ
jgi:hypothetical protein